MIAYHINKRRVILTLTSAKLGCARIILKSKEILALADRVKNFDCEVENWNVRDLAKKYKPK